MAGYTKLASSAAASIESADEEAASSSPDANSRSSCNFLAAVLQKLGLNSSGGSDPDWHARVQEAWWYRISCFMYCVAGGVTLLRPEPLERHMVFPWRVMGLSVFFNGFASYMADVETWGRPSVWKAIDLVFATSNSLMQIGIVATAAFGGATFPWPSPAFLGAGVAIALVCKQRAAAAMRDGNCDAFLRWHAAWHYTLPAGAVIGQCWLHRACDYSWTGGCACAT